MSKKDDADQKTRKDSASQATPVVKLDRVRDKLQIKRQDEKAAALAAQFHQAMGWKGKPDTFDNTSGNTSGKKGKRKKKRT